MDTRPSLVDRSILTAPPQVYSIDNGIPKGLSIKSSPAPLAPGPSHPRTSPPSYPKKKSIILNILLIIGLGVIGFALWKRSKSYKPEPPPPNLEEINVQQVKPINYAEQIG